MSAFPQPPADHPQRRRPRPRGPTFADGLKVVGLVAFAFGVMLHVYVARSFLADDNGSGGATPVAANTPAVTPTAPAQAEATPEPDELPDRTDCEEIRGTDYRSPAEREFFLANCVTSRLPPLPAGSGPGTL